MTKIVPIQTVSVAGKLYTRYDTNYNDGRIWVTSDDTFTTTSDSCWSASGIKLYSLGGNDLIAATDKRNDFPSSQVVVMAGECRVSSSADHYGNFGQPVRHITSSLFGDYGKNVHTNHILVALDYKLIAMYEVNGYILLETPSIIEHVYMPVGNSSVMCAVADKVYVTVTKAQSWRTYDLSAKKFFYPKSDYMVFLSRDNEIVRSFDDGNSWIVFAENVDYLDMVGDVMLYAQNGKVFFGNRNIESAPDDIKQLAATDEYVAAITQKGDLYVSRRLAPFVKSDIGSVDYIVGNPAVGICFGIIKQGLACLFTPQSNIFNLYEECDLICFSNLRHNEYYRTDPRYALF